MPIAAFTVSATGRRGGIGSIAYSQVMRGLVVPVAQVRRIVPQPAQADAHARREKVPEIRFAQENPVAVELGQMSLTPGSDDAGASNPGIAIATHFHVDQLKVGAD